MFSRLLRSLRRAFVAVALVALLAAGFFGGAGATVIPLPGGSPLQASPASLAFAALGKASAQSFVVSTNVAPLTATVKDPSVASVSSDVAKDATHQFLVTPLAAGNTTVIVTDRTGATIAVVPVSVSVAAPSASATAGAAAASGSAAALFGAGAALLVGIFALSHGSGSSSGGGAPTTPPTVSPSQAPTAMPTAAPTSSSTASAGPTSTPSAVATQTATPSPSPTPYISPTPIPATPTPGPLTVNPSTIAFVIGQSPSSAPFTAVESGYSGVFGAVSANTQDATVSPSSGIGPSAMFTVTAVGPGTTTINVSDANGNRAAVTVQVTQTNVIVNRRPRREHSAPPPAKRR